MSSIVRKMWCCGARSLRSPEEVPKGRVRVWVGRGDDVLRKFEMEASYLNYPLFEGLLRQSEEEFGYSYDGALRIACEVDLFQYLVHLLDTNSPSARYMGLPDLMNKFSGSKTASQKASSGARSGTTLGQLLAGQ